MEPKWEAKMRSLLIVLLILAVLPIWSFGQSTEIDEVFDAELVEMRQAKAIARLEAKKAVINTWNMAIKRDRTWSASIHEFVSIKKVDMGIPSAKIASTDVEIIEGWAIFYYEGNMSAMLSQDGILVTFN